MYLKDLHFGTQLRLGLVDPLGILSDRYLGSPGDVRKLHDEFVAWKAVHEENFNQFRQGRLEIRSHYVSTNEFGTLSAAFNNRPIPVFIDREAILVHGFDNYISKPIDPELLAGTMRQMPGASSAPTSDNQDRSNP